MPLNLTKIFSAFALIIASEAHAETERLESVTPGLSHDTQCQRHTNEGISPEVETPHILLMHHLTTVGCELVKSDSGEVNNLGSEITRLQEYLNETLQDMSVNEPIAVDGKMGPETSETIIIVSQALDYRGVFFAYLDPQKRAFIDFFLTRTAKETSAHFEDGFNYGASWALEREDQIIDRQIMLDMLDDLKRAPRCEEVTLNPYYQGSCYHEATHQEMITVPAPAYATDHHFTL